jgi:Ca2+-binding RTX toxin-like protein
MPIILGTSKNDKLHGTEWDDAIFGYGGEDTIYAGGENDYLNGGEDDDHLYGGEGDDLLYGENGDDWLYGEAGGDWMEGGRGHDRYFVDDINDRVIETGSGWTDSVQSTIDYVLPDLVENLVLVGTAIRGEGNGLLNRIWGNSLNNELYGGDGVGVDELYGGLGQDRLFAGSYGARLFGEDDNDQLYGGSGEDSLDGGLGADWMEGGDDDDGYVVDDPGDVVFEWAGGDSFWGDGVTAYINYTLPANVERLILAHVVDGHLNGTGNDLHNNLFGNNYNNILNGLGGSDGISGFDGHDTLTGGPGADLLIGGLGRDVLSGGSEADTFAFQYLADSVLGSEDRILDFSRADGDRIDVSGIDARTATGAFIFIGQADFSGVRGELRARDGFIEGDVNGDGAADLRIEINDSMLVATDFYL